jgi:hypothetical protein
MKTGKKVFCDSLSTAAFDFIEACGCEELAFPPEATRQNVTSLVVP